MSKVNYFLVLSLLSHSLVWAAEEYDMRNDVRNDMRNDGIERVADYSEGSPSGELDVPRKQKKAKGSNFRCVEEQFQALSTHCVNLDSAQVPDCTQAARDEAKLNCRSMAENSAGGAISAPSENEEMMNDRGL